MPGPLIHILLATHNGALFLAEQIASIQAQRQSNWRLLIRDDGSTDATPSIIEDFVRADPRIERIRRRAPGDMRGSRDGADPPLGPATNFSVLLEAALARGADWIAFCDQDDVWAPDKLYDELQQLELIEDRLGVQTPILVHADLAVVDRDLRPIHESFMSFQRIHHEDRDPLGTLLVQNFVTGSTCLMNRALAKFAAPIPPHAIMHDWWIALCAAATGAIGFVPKALVLYRQHDSNQIGAEGFWRSLDPRRRGWRIVSAAGSNAFLATLEQARALADRLDERACERSTAARARIRAYRDLFEQSMHPLRRAIGVLRLGIRRQDRLRQSLLAWRLLLLESAPAAFTADNADRHPSVDVVQSP